MTTVNTAAVPKADASHLDRANINAVGQVESMPDDLASDDDSSSASSVDGVTNDKPKKLSRRRRLTAKTKKILHIHHEGPDINLVSPAPILADAPETESDARLTQTEPVQEKKSLKDLLHKPLEGIQATVQGQGGHQVASTIVATEISHGREVELVRAYNVLDMVKTDNEKLLAIKEIDKMKVERQHMFVRWTMDRHVTKVRKLPEHTVPIRHREDFVVLDLADGKYKMDWEAYGKYVSGEICYLSTVCLLTPAACNAIRREIRWGIYRGGIGPAKSQQAVGRALHRTALDCLGSIPGAGNVYATYLSVGRSQRDPEIPHWIPSPLGLQPRWSRNGKQAHLCARRL